MHCYSDHYFPVSIVLTVTCTWKDRLIINLLTDTIQSHKVLKNKKVFQSFHYTCTIAITLNLQVGGQLFRALMNTFANSDNTNAPSSFT